MNLDEAKEIAVGYLDAMERRDLDAARAFVGDAPKITFPGGRNFTDIEQIARNSGGRYTTIRKSIERRDAWQDGATTCVLVSGTLFGEWPDGTAFEGIRFADRFEIVDRRIVRQEVWNDSGERLLAMQREAAE
ncbi:nuclear transport factor 2 family protein [Stappia sp.]|uniref:nuclear transport factor 2 family protein n=1 Tax=Stappia sp. TaxID=1870903 RepID=UPI003C7C659E